MDRSCIPSWVTAWVLLASCVKVPTDDTDFFAVSPGGPRAGNCFALNARGSEKPTVCHDRDGTYITGLPLHHNWTRDTRVRITQSSAPGEQTVAVAWVSESYTKAARINVIIQEPDKSIEGGTAHVVTRDTRIRFDNYYGRVENRTGKHVTFDIGSGDGVREHDVYEARDPLRPDVLVGRVQVTRTYASRSEARILSEDQTIGGQHELVLSKRSESDALPSIKVAFVPIITGQMSQSPSTAATADDHAVLAAALRHAGTMAKTIDLKLVELEAEPVGTPETLPTRIARRARQRGADQVIWISGPCGPGGDVARACHATIPEDPEMPLTTESLQLPSTSPEATLGDSLQLLGQIAYAAEAFEEASYHLRSWATDVSVPMAPEALIQLAETEYALGQLDRSRMWLAQFLTRSNNRGSIRNRLAYFRARAQIACSDANVPELTNLNRSIKDQAGRHPELKHVLLDLLDCRTKLSLHSGDQKEAEVLAQQGYELGQELQNHEAIGRFVAYMGQVADNAGDFDRSLRDLQQAHAAARTAGDPRAEAYLALALAKSRVRAGIYADAQKFAQSALDIYKRLQHEDGIVECLPVLVQIMRRLAGAEQANRFLESEQRALKRGRLARARFALRLAKTYLDLERGELTRIHKTLRSLLEDARKQKLADEEIQVLGMTAELFLMTGQMQQANRAIDQYWTRTKESGRDSDQAHARILYGEFRLQEGDAPGARKVLQEANGWYRRIKDHAGTANAVLVLGEVEREFGSVDAARQHYQEAEALFKKVQDADGVRFAALGMAELAIWREGSTSEHATLRTIVGHFNVGGNAIGYLRASLQLEWAKFLKQRDQAASLSAIKAIRERAKRKNLKAVQAEAQMLIACVHRADSAHELARQAYREAGELYATIGRHSQEWPCSHGEDPKAVKLAEARHDPS